MATYVYETIPPAGQTPRRFELVQSMKDAPLAEHPETGEPVRRVISGGYGFIGAAERSSGPAAVASCAPGCACHNGPRIPASA